MTEEQDVREIRRIVGLLERTHRIARDATMTGALGGGKDYAARQFNAIVTDLSQRGIVLPGYFPPLSEEASLDEVGIACALLADYLKADLPDERGHEGKGKHGQHGGFNIQIGDIPELKNIGQVIRESLPEWMRAAREGKQPTARPAGPGAENNPAATQGDLGGLRESGAGGVTSSTSLTDVESRLAEVGAKIQVVAEQLRREELPATELQRLANELSRLGREQAQIAQEAASKRALGGHDVV
jgi:hypothetical protein